MSNHQLDRYSFLWSEVRLLVAALALFLGGVPPVFLILPGLPIIGALLTLCWVISGLSSAYLLYRWFSSGQHIFGGKEMNNTVAFLVSCVSGINLGLTGILGRNIGMSITSNYIVFIVVGLLYLWAAVQLYRAWNSHDQELFSH